MKKILKILLIILIIIILFIVLIAGTGFYVLYKDTKWYDNAEDMGTALFRTERFNEKLRDCSPSYNGMGVAGELWEIRGLVEEYCIFRYEELDTSYDENRDEVIISSKWHQCKLPYEIYFNPEAIDWSSVFSEYCS